MTDLPDAGGSISTGTKEEAFGFERWEFFLSNAAVQNMLEKGARIGDPEYIKELPGRFWMTDSRVPSRYEIAGISLKPLDGSRVQIEAIIRRGHWVLAEFLRKHPAAFVSRDPDFVLLECDCHPSEPTKKLPLSSFPETRQ